MKTAKIKKLNILMHENMMILYNQKMDISIVFISFIEVFKYIIGKFINTGDFRLDGLLIALIFTVVAQCLNLKFFCFCVSKFNIELDLRYKFISKIMIDSTQHDNYFTTEVNDKYINEHIMKDAYIDWDATSCHKYI
jgi:hypothetical protein